MDGFGFVGRQAEMAAIAEMAERAAGGRAGTVWIEGDAGAGKSSLLRAAIEGLPSGFTPLRAEADELAREVPLDVVVQLGVRRATDPFEAGLELLAHLGTHQDGGPVALVLEDLHWADPASRLALLTATRRLHDDRVLVLATSRPTADVDDGWDRHVTDPDRSRRVALGALSIDDVVRLAEATGVPLGGRDAERLHRHTGGHALYVRTLLRELTPDQLASPDHALPAPRSLASTTIRRLLRLPDDAQLLGSALAVLNQRAPLDLAGRVAGVDDPAVALDALLDTGLVTWWPSDTGTPVEFVHPLYRTAIYDDLTPTRRRALHRAAAEALGADAAMAHRVASAHQGDEDLVADLASDARTKAQAGARALAARDLLWASSISGDAASRERHLLAACWHLLNDGQIARAEGHRDEVEACAPSPLRSLVLGSLARSQGDADAAERFRDVEGLAGPGADDQQLLACALARLAGVLTTFGQGEEAIATGRRALALGPEDPEIERYAWSSIALGEAIARGGVAGLEALAPRLTADAAEVDPGDAELLVTRSMLAAAAGRTTAAIEDVTAAIRSGRISSSVHQRPRAHLHLALLLQESGDTDLAATHARTAVSLIADEAHLWLEAQVHSAMAMLAALGGRWEEAEAEVALALAGSERSGTFEAHYAAHFADSAVARARGDHRRHIEIIRGLVGDGDSAAIPMVSSLSWWPPFVHAHIDAGDLVGAEHQIAQMERAAADRRLDLSARATGLRARLAAASDRPDEAQALFVESLAGRGPDDPVVDRGITLQAHGQLLLARGQRREAVEQLRSAHELFARLGAEPFRARVQADLDRAGIRSAPDDDRSPLDLTDRERDVAALVCTGMTNKEVAAELYVSPKAVEYHLGNIYGKLGIANRRDLRERLVPAG